MILIIIALFWGSYVLFKNADKKWAEHKERESERRRIAEEEEEKNR